MIKATRIINKQTKTNIGSMLYNQGEQKELLKHT